MGKYAISVASYATNINDITGNPTKNAIASICHKREVGDYKSVNASLLETMHNGLAVQVNSGIKYGRDEYVYGLPEGYVVTADIDVSEVQRVISEELGTEVVIEAAFIAPPDEDYFGRWYSYENWGGDPLTGYLSRPPVEGNASLNNTDWTNRAQLEMQIRYSSHTGTPKYETFIESPPAPVDLQKQYYQVIYTREDTIFPTSDFWIYELGSNTIPELEVEIVENLDSPFLPVVPVRENNINLGPEAVDGEFVYDENGEKIVPDTDLYRTSVKLCEKFRIGFDEIAREITGNEDVESIDHAYIIFGIDVRSETKQGKLFLFDFFEKIAFSTIGGSEIEVKDAQYYRIKLTFDSCTSIDEVGELDDVEIEYSGDTMYLRAPTGPGMYREITVVNLRHINFVYQGHTVNTSLSDSADEDNYNFIVPLDYFIAQESGSLFDREKLYVEAAKLVFNCYEKKKLKWYQRGWFKVILVVIAVVVTVFTGVGGAFVAALEAGIAATVLFLVQTVLVSALIQYGFQMLVDILGVEIGILLAIVAAVASFMVGDATGILSAENLMTASSGFIMGSDASLSADMEKLADDMAAWTEEAQKLEDELNEAFEELDTDTFFNPYDFINSGNIFIPNEVPEEYFNRTIHTGNIGVGVLSVPENYVDNALTLPTVSRFKGYDETGDSV